MIDAEMLIDALLPYTREEMDGGFAEDWNKKSRDWRALRHIRSILKQAREDNAEEKARASRIEP